MTKTSHIFPNEAVMIRLATEADAPALELLAELDSARPPVAPALLAERADQAVAAVSLTDGVVIANPFLPSGDLVALLRLRARQVSLPSAREHSVGLVRWAATSRKAIRNAGDRLHRSLERAHVSIQRLERGQQPVEHRR